GLEEWECHPTPGHTPGHVSFYRPSDGVLIAGDALTTMDLDSFIGTVTKMRKLCRPPVPATTDWQQARESVQLLASLRPRVIAAGHGNPMRDAAAEARRSRACHGRHGCRWRRGGRVRGRSHSASFLRIEAGIGAQEKSSAFV